MRVGIIVSLACFLGAASGVASGQTTSLAEVRDTVRLFGADARREAETSLARASARSGVDVEIETIESLKGETIGAEALHRAKESKRTGIYILIAKDEKKISDPLVKGAAADRVPQAKRAAILAAFVEGFKKGDFDAGLRNGVEEIVAALASEEADSPLILRGQVRLTLAGARRVLAGAEAKAAEMKLKVNMAVVDDGGHLLAFARLDGARPASAPTAITKAVTAATFRAPTGPLPAGTLNPDPLLNLSLQNAALASGGKITTLYGGIPITVDGQVIGAIGVGGGTGEQDAEVAKAGVAAFEADLKK